MRPVEQKPAVAGAVGTILVWILIFLFFYLGAVLFAPKPFKTIKIRLDAPTKSEKQVKKVEQNSAKTQKSEAKETPKGDASSTALSETRSNPVSQDLPATPSLPTPSPQPAQAKQDVKKTESKPAPKKQAESGKRKTENSKPDATKTAKSQSKKTESKKSEPAKSAPKQTKQAPSKTVEKPKMSEQTLAPDLTNGGNFAPKKKPVFDADFDKMFENVEGNTSKNSAPQKQSSPNSSNNPFSKETVAQGDKIDTSATGKSNNEKRATGVASGETSKKLSGATGAKKYKGTVTTASGSSTPASNSGIQVSDGRKLIKPNPPVLYISSEEDNIIGEYTIKFKVRPNGYVDSSSITITPTVLSMTIQNELKTQLSSWQFSEGKTDGIAQFPYKIERR